MRHKPLIAIGGVLLLGCVLAWFSRGSAASPSEDFSPEDFKRIREVTRHRMWARALPDFSVQTIRALPRLLRRFGSSRIRQIDVLPARTINVHVESSSGPYYYLAEKYEKAGRWDWRVVKEGIWPQGDVVINLNGGPGYPEIRVDGGFALFGGRILLSLLRTGFRHSLGEGWCPRGNGPCRKASSRLLVRITSGSPMRRTRSPGRIHRTTRRRGASLFRKLHSPCLHQMPLA